MPFPFLPVLYFSVGTHGDIGQDERLPRFKAEVPRSPDSTPSAFDLGKYVLNLKVLARIKRWDRQDLVILGELHLASPGAP